MISTEEEIVAALNKRLNIRIIFCCVFTAIVYLLCLVFGGLAQSISSWTANYIPSVAKLNVNHSLLNGFTGKFFGVSVFLIPFFLLVYVWREEVLIRFRYGQPKSGRGMFETVILLYVLCIPFICLVFFIFYAAPLEIPANPRLSGQLVLHVMLSTYIGLFVFGILLIPTLAILAALLIACIWLPFSAVIHHLSTKEIK
jgi:hypothetical protein